MTPETKATTIRIIRQRRSELRSRIASHLNKDAERAYDDWRELQKREAREAVEELARLDRALEELETL